MRRFAFLCVWIVLMNLFSAALAGHYQNFRTAVYVRAYEVEKMADPRWLEDTWAIVEKQLKVDKVYLEVHRDLLIVKPDTLTAATRFFRDRGILVSGGIATVRNEDKLFETFDYSDPAHLEKIREIVRATAQAFDEFIIDDFFFTSSKTPSAFAAKGNQTWTDFRLKLMTDVSREVVLKTAREVNPKVRVIIKYPNWYQHFHGMGYNLETQPPLFDAIYTGTETRDSVYNHQHLQPYHSYLQVRYFDQIKPGHNDGGWVDTGNRLVADRYAEQLWLTLFAKAPEIMLFALNELIAPFTPGDRAPWQGTGTTFDYADATRGAPGLAQPTLAGAARNALETADRLVGKLGQPRGIASYRPYHSRGEDFLPTYLGGIGLPIELYPHFPIDAETVLLTADAGHDPEIIAKMEAHLRRGHTLVITSGLVERLQDRGLDRLVDLSVGPGRSATKEFWGRGFPRQSSPEEILLPILHYNTNDSWELISTMTHGLGYPLLHYAPIGQARLYVLTIPDNFADLYQLPTGVLDLIRRTVSPASLPVLRGPAKVALMAYDNGAVLVESFRDESVTVSVSLPVDATRMFDETNGTELRGHPEGDRQVYTVALKPHSVALLTRR